MHVSLQLLETLGTLIGIPTTRALPQSIGNVRRSSLSIAIKTLKLLVVRRESGLNGANPGSNGQNPCRLMKRKGLTPPCDPSYAYRGYHFTKYRSVEPFSLS